MNVTPENIIVNSCEYTPVYLIQSPGVTQTGTYYVAQSDEDEQKPVTDNLKRFYENSGNLENSLLSSPHTKPRILKKQNSVGNNLKLASFLLPKSESIQNSVQTISTISNIQNVPNLQKPIPIPTLSIPVTNVVVKPAVTTASENVAGSRVEMDRKIVRVGTIPYASRYQNRPVPKTKPKEKNSNPSKLTSVQLLKLGETYHSLNQLSEDQMKIVNKALKIFSNPEQAPMEPAYDPVTNTKFIYKVVSPRDLTVVGKNGGVFLKKKQDLHKQTENKKQIQPQTKKQTQNKKQIQTQNKKQMDTKKQPGINKLQEVKVVANVKKKLYFKKQAEMRKKLELKKLAEVDQKQTEVKKQSDVKKQPDVKKSPSSKKLEEINDQELEQEVPVEPKVTRSGRTVKLKKPMIPKQSPQKPKKRTSVINCFQCSAEFCSFYRLQRHYESHPTHIPARIHTNLFHCLVAIINGGPEADQANIFIQQLEHLIEKLKSLLPCLLKKIDGCDGTQCSVNDDIGRLFDMNPGKYNLNMNALSCIKDKDGYCVHNPAPKPQFNSDFNKTSQPNSKDEVTISESESEDCARINSIDKWPRVSKRLWKLKQQKSQKENAKKMRLISESDHFIELGEEELSTQNNTDNSAMIKKEPEKRSPNTAVKDDYNKNDKDKIPVPTSFNQSKKPKPQFRSTHFDIRSSPIKLPSALVRKFQLDPEKMTNMKSFEVQILRPLNIRANNDGDPDSVEEESLHTFEVTFGQNENTQTPQCDTAINNELTFHITEEWNVNSEPNNEAHNLIFDSKELESTLMNIKEKTCLLETPTKSNILVTSLTHDDKANDSFEPSLIYMKDKSNCLLETSDSDLLNIKENPSGFYEPSKIHVKTDSLIEPSMIHINNKAFKTALSNVRERSNNLFETTISQTEPKNMTETKSDAYGLTLPHMKERSGSLYSSELMHKKDKDSLIGPSLIHVRDSDIDVFDTISHTKEDFIEPMLHGAKSDTLIDSTLLNEKNEIPQDIHDQSNSTNIDDSRLLSNEGQSVLNFLESLSNEHLGLSYPETDIRNNSVDFQLDLFSFNSSG